MKNIAAYALLVLGGNSEPTVDDVARLLNEAGAPHDIKELETLIQCLAGRPFHEIVTVGLENMAQKNAP